MLLRYKARSAFRTARLFIYNAVQRYVSVGPVSGKSRTHNAPVFVKGGRGETERKDVLLRLLANGSIIPLDQLPPVVQNPCQRAVQRPREICI